MWQQQLRLTSATTPVPTYRGASVLGLLAARSATRCLDRRYIPKPCTHERRTPYHALSTTTSLSYQRVLTVICSPPLTCGTQIARFCQEGFRTAVETNCYDACLNGGRLASYLTEIRLDESCERSLKQTPRPLCHDACVRGYRSGVQDMTLDLVKRMAEVWQVIVLKLKPR